MSVARNRKGPPADLDALRGLAHRCDPALCRASGSCCACFEVEVTRAELGRIIGFLPEAERFKPGLRDEDLYDRGEDGFFVLDTEESGRCVLAYRDRRGRILCSLHAAALARGLDPAKVKAQCCMLWPLALTESKPETLMVHEDALDFPCNTPRDPSLPGLDPGVADLIRGWYGETYLAGLLGQIDRTDS
jgi:hypothetical protein